MICNTDRKFKKIVSLSRGFGSFWLTSSLNSDLMRYLLRPGVRWKIFATSSISGESMYGGRILR